MKKTKIGILTYHFANNYGAVLQCYALMRHLSKKGLDVGVVNYRSFQDRESYKFISNKPMIIKQIKRFLKDILNGFARQKQIKTFDDFREKHLSLASTTDDFDILLIGSDQVWNTSINNFDNSYFGNGISATIKASYAASIGNNDLNGKDLEYLKNGLAGLDILSVREEFAQVVCSELTLTPISVVCDPVFLLDKTDYEMLIGNNNSLKTKNYILIYSLEHSDEIDELVIKLSKEHNLKSIYIHPHGTRLQTADIYEDTAGPIECIRLIKNATLLITNSFHGLAFATIFNIPVYSVFHSTRDSRQKTLIKYFQLSYEVIADNIYLIGSPQMNAAAIEYVDNSKKFIDQILLQSEALYNEN